MKTFISFLERIASFKSLAILTVIYLSFPAYFLKNAETKLNELSGKPITIIDLTMGYNPVRTISLLQDYSPEARIYYATVESTIDVAYPIVYAFLFAIILVLLYRNKRFGISSWVYLLPFVMLVFDYIENFYIVKLLTQTDSFFGPNILPCELAKLIKWSIFFIILLLIINGLLRNTMAWLSRRKVWNIRIA